MSDSSTSADAPGQIPERELRALLDSTPDILSRYDSQLRIVYMNRIVERHTGVPAETFLGKRLSEVPGLPPGNVAQWEDSLRRVRDTGEPDAITFSLPAGETFRHYEARAVPERGPDGAVRGVITITRDVTDLRSVEAARELQRRDLEATVAALAAQQHWLEDVLDLFPVPVLFVEPGTARVLFANKAADEMAGGRLPRQRNAADDASAFYCTDAAGDRVPDDRMPEARVARGERLEGYEVDWHTPAGVRSLLIWGDTLPSMHGRQAVGVLVFQDIAEIKRSESALRASEHRLSLALAAANMGTWEWEVATGELSWSELLEPIHGMAPGSFDGTFTGFLKAILDEDRPGVMATIERALESGTEFRTEFRVPHPDGSTHWIAGEGRVLRDDAGRPVKMIGVGMDITPRKRIEEELRAHVRQETVLRRIGEALLTSTDPEAIQTTAVTALGEALHADRCYFSLIDVTKDEAVIGRDWHRDDLPSLAGVYRLSEMEIEPRELFRRRHTAVVRDIEKAPLGARTRRAARDLGVRSSIGVALFEGREIVALLSVAVADSPRNWTAADVALVEAVAAQTRSTIEAARIRQREHDIAERLQQALRPRLPERVPGLDLKEFYRAAFEEASVGGDFFDVFPLGEARSALVVADVSGKGLAAAAQVATVRHMLRTLLYTHESLTEAVTRLNDLLSDNRLISGFATLFVGIYDGAARRLEYVCCGQEPGLVRRARDGAVEPLAPTGPVLGAFSGSAFEAESLTLAPGDILAVFTDGLTEAGRDRTGLLGIDGVSGLLVDCPADPEAGDVVECLMGGVLRFAGNRLSDDVCLLVGVVRE